MKCRQYTYYVIVTLKLSTNKGCIFSHFTATPPSPSSLRSSQRNLSVQPLLWLVIFCTTKTSAGEGEVEKLSIFNEHPVDGSTWHGYRKEQYISLSEEANTGTTQHQLCCDLFRMYLYPFTVSWLPYPARPTLKNWFSNSRSSI